MENLHSEIRVVDEAEDCFLSGFHFYLLDVKWAFPSMTVIGI
jgi:hypothetical protein